MIHLFECKLFVKDRNSIRTWMKIMNVSKFEIEQVLVQRHFGRGGGGPICLQLKTNGKRIH